MRQGLIAGVVAISALTVSCAESAADLGYGVTERNGEAELTVSLCGAKPPGRLVVARASSSEIQDLVNDVDIDELAEVEILFEVEESDWDSDPRVFALGEVADGPPSSRRLIVYSDSRSTFSNSRGFATMPQTPWPTYPLALTSPFDYQRSVRLDTERGDLCERR